MRFAVLACTLILGSLAHADDPAPAKARAQAALALAKSKAQPTIATAPAPRPVVLDYSAAKKLSLERGVPVVVFVGCDPLRVQGSLTAVVPTLEGHARGTVLICYPSGGDLWADASMPCPAKAEEIEGAVKVAAKKSEAKPRKLNWS